MYLGVRGKLGIDARTPQEVEGDDGVGQKTIPKVQRKVGVGTAQPCNEMVFEGPDGPFSCISAVEMRWSQLKVNLGFAHMGLKGLTGFIIEALELGAESSGGEQVKSPFVAGENFRTGAGLQGLRKNAIGIIVIQDEQISITTG